MAFVGRERELARLATALQRAAEGEHGRVVLTGAGGIGVTRLLDELTQRLVGLPGVVVARGTAYASCTGEAYHALGTALSGALATLDDDRVRHVIGHAGHDLGALLGDGAERLDTLGIDRTAPRLEAPEQLGSRVQEAVLGMIERLAGDDGVVLLALEDLHHADPATRGFVQALMRIGRPLRVCLVLSYQPDELNRRHPARELADQLLSDPTVEHLALGPLDATSVGHLVATLQGDRPAGDILAAVVEGSGGNPLMATQLVAAEGTLAGVRLSDPFEQVVAARLEALPAATRRVIRLLAAARQPLRRSLVLGMTLSDGRTTVAAIGQALASGMVVERDGLLAIAHDRYAEAIEDHELPTDRAGVHAALAVALADHPARAAWHWAAAARTAEARAAHLAAAAEAARLDPGETTLLHLQRGLELSPDAADLGDPDLATLLAAAARATAAQGAFRRAAALMRRAVEATVARPVPTTSPGPAAHVSTGGGHATTGGRVRADPAAPRAVLAPRDDTQRLRVGAMTEEIGRYQWAGGDLEGGLRSMEQALAMMPAGPSPQRARALASLAQHLMIDGRFPDSARHAQQSREVALAAGRGALAELGHATCTLGVDVAYMGELERGLRLLAEAVDIARRAGRLDDLMRAAANRTTLLDLDGRREEALAVVEDGIAQAEAGGLAGTYGAFLRGNAADILYQLGRWSESEAECRAAMEWQPAGVAWFSPTLYLGLVLVESRADDEAERLVGQTLLQLDTVAAGQWSALVQRAAVSLALWRGQLHDAVRVAAREWPRILETNDPILISLAASTCLEAAAAAAEHGRTERDIGLVAAATELADQVAPDAEQLAARDELPPGVAARTEAELHLAMARAHRARMRGRPSASAWRRLATAWTDRRMPYLAAKARWWQALALLETNGSRDDARDAIGEAWRIAAALPARPLLRALSDLALRARLPLPDAPERVAELVGPPAEARPLKPIAPGSGRFAPAPPAGARPAIAVPVMRGGASGTSGRRPTPDPEPSAETGLVAIPVAGRGEGAGTGGPEAVADAIGERLLPGAATVSAGLSPREMEVLRIICEGRTDREIAERLYISERTVHVHVRKVLAKLGVSSRTQAAALAFRQGIVPMRSGTTPEA
ncbi:MAG: LuxR C-terminal-related transcriptional regulator [Chloroflexota bacterium]